jgi:predicted 2-oxoglutarate/Fe(II)-dependent dioxygenase YbiX
MELYKPFDFLSINECQEIIQYGKTHGLIDSEVFHDGQYYQSDVDKKYRKSKQCWLEDKKYKKKISNLFKTFDKKIILHEHPQIVFYNPTDFFKWHKDLSISKGRHWFRLRDFERVLSLAVELQPARNSGIQFDYKTNPNVPRTHDYEPVTLTQGQAIVFTSKDMHCVTNSGKEQRISLVAWGSVLVK